MSSARLGLPFFLLFLNISLWGQQTQQATAAPPAPQDPQALNALSQALTVAGGTSAIRAIQDYTATGTITYSSDQNAQGPVTVQGLGGTEFRLDANLPAGARSWAVHEGFVTTKSEEGTIWSMGTTGPVPSSDAFPFQTPLFPGSIAFPFRQLSSVVGNPGYSLSYKGVIVIDGHWVHEIKFQRGSSEAASSGGFVVPSRTREIFIDTASFQIVKVSDALPKGVPHAMHYSDYRSVGGILMPFSITEEVAGQQTWAIQLNQINFNTGLQEASFAIQ
jgi:hypothetical protein